MIFLKNDYKYYLMVLLLLSYYIKFDSSILLINMIVTYVSYIFKNVICVKLSHSQKYIY